MSHAANIPATLSVRSGPLVFTSVESLSVPWTIWFVVAGMVLDVISGIWDGAWHHSIGADTSWAPPHILQEVSAVVPAIACAFAILAATFTAVSRTRDSSVRVLGFHAPAGVFITAWGSLAILVAGPFDNWWHQAYGEVTIATPPHLLGLLGSIAAHIGGMAWLASIMNRSTDQLRGRLTWLFLFVAATGLGNFSGFIPGAPSMHSAGCYLTFALFVPCCLVASGWGSAHKWGLTMVAAIFTGISLAAEWLLPLIPAQPKFGPVYHNITHLVPSGFPPLLLVPAFIADLLLQRLRQPSAWMRAVCVGPALVLSFLAVQWPFASFLMLPASRNWIFGTAYFSFKDPAGILFDPYKFEAAEKLGAFLLTMTIAFVASILTTRLGLAWGDWMRRLRR